MPKNGTTPATPPYSAPEGDNASDGSAAAEAALRLPRGRGLRTTFRSLRHRNYRLYFFGQLVSLMGTWMQSTAVTWLAFERTGESKWTAMILVAQILPTFFLGGVGGVLADRVPKRTLILCTQSIFLLLALVLAVMGWTDILTARWLVAVSAAGGIVQAIDLPARLAFVMDMASREDLMNAVALNSLLFNVARALGPAVGGQIMRWISPEMCFVGNALSYLAVLWALASMSVAGAARLGAQGTGVRALLSGLTFIVRRKQLLFLALLMAVISCCGWPSQTLLPALAKSNLHSDEIGYSWMLSGTGAGALVAAWTVATFGSLEHRSQMLGGGVAIVVSGLILLALAGNLLFAVCCSALIGYGLILFLATSQSIMQLSSGDHNRGRVMAVWATIQSGAVPLGSILSGAAADRWGVRPVLLGLGLCCVTAVSALLAAFGLPRSASRAQLDHK
ncbi:MAG TPA: MFS transporter [Gemmataceae bacterium]|nr:MFS transporter [Gemmataceae bacterium]